VNSTVLVTGSSGLVAHYLLDSLCDLGHRVVGSTGSLVGYAGGLDRKRTLLQLEGALLNA